MSNSADALRRWLGMFCLSIAAGMLIWGRTLLAPHLNGGLFFIYWAGCLALAGTAVAIALVDVVTIRRQLRREHEELIRRTFENIRRGESDLSSE